MKLFLFLFLKQFIFCSEVSVHQLKVHKDMILIPAGTYHIGSNIGKYDQNPRVKIQLSSYLIDRYEVSIKKYKQFLQDTNYISEGPWQRSLHQNNDNLPVRFITYTDAKNYAKWAKKDLPTEAQWEVACGTKKFTLKRKKLSIGPQEVNFAEVSDYGVYNLSGNVREWVNDWYDRYYRLNQLKKNDLFNPQGPQDNTAPELKFSEINAEAGNERSTLKVVKGGSWMSKYNYQVQASKRAAHNPKQWFNDVGFRCVINVEDN
ncbi:MAG: SUMF1/EgtB/PvdO family nonheme iron enzyme [Candidatus Cloacimonetes bacterium]|nr:SUMF1/EgtB/PvdO family nonheme iron enzyme [Candidatus Cloacimonadota bacterium]